MDWKEYGLQFKNLHNGLETSEIIVDSFYLKKYFSREMENKKYEEIGAKLFEHLKLLKVKSCGFRLDQDPREVLEIMAGFYLKQFVFDRYLSQKTEYITINIDNKELQSMWENHQYALDSLLWARSLCSTPANDMTPDIFCNLVQQELKFLGYRIEILPETTVNKMQLLKSVSLGSESSPRVIKIYKGKPRLAFIGKGVTFDTGGVSLKPSKDMHRMMADMSGAAAVVAAARSLHACQDIMFLCGLVENAIDGKAQRPGDIWTSYSGKTVQVLNTDAEGRLVLGDLVAYAQEEKCESIITIATLTGAVKTALGTSYAGFFTNDGYLKELLESSAQKSGEYGWFLPFSDDYASYLRGSYSDLQNIADNAGAGATIGAKFIEMCMFDKYTTSFAHIDMGGVNETTRLSSTPYNGFGTRLLEQIGRQWFLEKSTRCKDGN